MEAKPDWRLVGVFDDERQFLYSVGLWERHATPELWASCLGECGHRASVKGIAMVLNDLATKLIESPTVEAFVNGWYPFDFGTGMLQLTPEPEAVGLTEQLETYQADPAAPVIRVKWRCCEGGRGTRDARRHPRRRLSENGAAHEHNRST